MNTKKKLVISLTSLAIVLVVAIAAVGITLAALSGTVNSSFTIKYTAYNVSATVTAKYKVGDAGPEKNFTGGEPDGSITFNPDDETASGTLSVTEPIALDYTDNEKFVVVTYTFKNNWNEEEGKSKLVVKADKDTITAGEGIKITYDTDDSGDFNDSDLSNLKVVEPQQTLTVKIKFELTNNGTKSVNLQVNLNWTLTREKIEE